MYITIIRLSKNINQVIEQLSGSMDISDVTTAMSALTVAEPMTSNFDWTDVIDCNLFGQICGVLDPASIIAFTLVDKQFLKYRPCITSFVVQNYKSCEYNGFLTKFLEQNPNVQTIRINDTDWQLTTTNKAIWLTTSQTIEFEHVMMPLFMERFFEPHDIAYIAFQHVAFNSPWYSNTFSLQFASIYICCSQDHLEYQQYYADDNEIRANLLGSDTCFDIIIEMPHVVENIKIKVTMDNETATAVDYVQLNPTTYKITTFTADNQLQLFNAFWGRHVVVSYDNIAIANLKPFKLSYMRCRITRAGRCNIAHERCLNAE